MESQWSNNLRRRMEAHKEPSPEGLWEEIELRLRKDKKRTFLVPVFLKREKVSLWSKRIGVAAAVAIILISIGHNNLNKTQDKQKLVSTHNLSSKQYEPYINSATQKSIHKEHKIITSYNNHCTTTESYETAQMMIEREALTDKVMISVIQPEKERLYNKIEACLSQPDSKYILRKKECSKEISVVEKEIAYNNGSDQNLKIRKKWGMSAFASNLPANIQEKYNGVRAFGSDKIDVAKITGMSILGEDPYTDISIYNIDKKTETSINHKLPLTAGISIHCNIYEQWGLKSGVTYTMLTSQLRSGSESHYYNSEQTLHYIGIPLSIYYNILENKRTSVYLSGGGLVEKNVSGKLAMDCIIDNKIISNKEEKLSINQLQWSLNTSIGIQYNLSKKLGLYTEPGVSYYLKNKSEIETIYKKNPVNLSLRFGLCFYFE